MYKNEKWDENNPQTPEQKLVFELMQDLKQVTTAFINLNISTTSPSALYVILRDAILGFAGHHVIWAVNALREADQIDLYIKETMDIFNDYVLYAKNNNEHVKELDQK